MLWNHWGSKFEVILFNPWTLLFCLIHPFIWFFYYIWFYKLRIINIILNKFISICRALIASFAFASFFVCLGWKLATSYPFISSHKRLIYFIGLLLEFYFIIRLVNSCLVLNWILICDLLIFLSLTRQIKSKG